MMKHAELTLRPATAADLGALNGVIERAIMTWQLPERVKRLALPSYRYSRHDMDALQMLVVMHGPDIVGIAAWEQADARDVPLGRKDMLLHGLYVDPGWHRQGVGKRLLQAVMDAVRTQGYDGLLVKAQPDAEIFFLAQGFEALAVIDTARDYRGRLWKSASGTHF